MLRFTTIESVLLHVMTKLWVFSPNQPPLQQKLNFFVALSFQLLFLSASLAWPLASAAPDAAAHSLLRRSLLLRDSQLPRSGRQASDRFDPDFFDADGFGDFAREDFRSRGGFRQDEFRDSPEIALVSRRRDGEREEDVYYADPADLWGVSGVE